MTDLVITGITGFLGRAIVDTVLERNMYNHVYGISRRWVDQERLARKWGNRVTMINGDVRDYNSVRDLFLLIQENNPTSDPDVIHCAAYKHISMAQTNTREVVDVNILGTRNTLDVSRIYGVRNLVFISTDKAASPVNVYGQSKAIAEQMVLNAKGVVLRFGNIWGSTGSLIEKWHGEMKKDKPVFEITEPAMTRYFYLIEDAVDYILMATDYTNCKIIPNLKSTTIAELAEAYQVACNKRAEIKIIGIRPGEKLHEQMTCLEELSMSSVEVIHDKYLHLTNGSYGELPTGFEGMLSSGYANRFSEQELVTMIRRDI
jgi:UDP-N-acetylglucosamine 4,6-dehydratase/5-epimerase